MELKDFIDPNFLQDFQDNFALCAGMASLIEDTRGIAVTKPSYFCSLCMYMIRTTRNGLLRCRECELRGAEEAAKTGKPAIYQCHAGLTDLAAPIMLRGKRIGAIYGGQILTEKPEERKYRRFADKIGLDPDEYMSAIKKIPVVSEGYIQAAAKVLFSIANIYSRIIYQKVKIQEKDRELILASNRLNSIFTTMSDGVLIINEKGVVKQVNQMAQKTFSKTSSEMVDKSIFNLVDGDTTWERGVLELKIFKDTEVLLDAGSGSLRCISSGIPITDEQGVASGEVILFRLLGEVQESKNHFNGARASFCFDDIIGQSPAILKTIHLASRAADSVSNILLEGESGTGKELFAHAIHNQSLRHKGPFVAVNCGAIPRELLESELFGYADGAFTGARRGGRPGKFELASGGSIFLDEIGDMPLDQQVVLLRVLQERKVTRVGDNKAIPVDVRIICATNKNLTQEVEKGNFRQDLYYRLNVIAIKIPPLRERREDIPLLFKYMLHARGAKGESDAIYVSPEVMQILQQYDWPGNVRELENVAERVTGIADNNIIRLEQLPQSILDFKNNILTQDSQLIFAAEIEGLSEREKRKRILLEKECQNITALLAQFGGNVSRVAMKMGISRSTLYRKMRQYNIGN